MSLIFTTNSNPILAKKITQLGNFTLGKTRIKTLRDGETYVQILNNTKGKKVFVIGSTFQPEKNLIELVLLLDALVNNQTKKIVLILPYFGYARQDRVDQPGEPLSARLMARFLKLAGASQIITIDLHSSKAAKFFGQSLKQLSALEYLAKKFGHKFSTKNFIVISPDKGAQTRAGLVAKTLGNLPLIVVKKYRPKPNVAQIMEIPDNIRGKSLIIVDDMVDTAGTLVALVKMLKKKGAAKIYCLITHPLLSPPAIPRLKRSPIQEFWTTDSIPLPLSKRLAKIKVTGLAEFLTSELL
ncbi:MAG: ribose-phosphate pyrophosphokinase [Patescibacteria group bacterium]